MHGNALTLVCVLPFLATLAAGAAPAAEGPGWAARWIGPPAEKGAGNLWVCYRKRFDLARKPGKAPARIAVDSRYWLWVNGKQVVYEGGLKRGPNPRDTYYDAFDLAPHLKAGSNTVAVLQWYWGKDGFSHKSSGQPGLLFQMDAGGRSVCSDATWRMRLHPAFGNATGKQPNYRISESPYLFDARADLGDWTAPAFDDGAWLAPRDFGAPPVAPWNGLQQRPIPFWKDYGLKEYANTAALPAQSDGRPIVAKLPYNAQVAPWLKVEAPAGLTIDMEADDALSEMHTQYITREGAQQFEGLAWMNGHAVVYHIPAGVKILGLKYRETGYDCEFTGSFHCDDPELNRLWEKCQRTLYITMRDNFMDCPDRERAQWWGDAANEIGEGFYALSPSFSLLAKKGIHNLMDWQRPDKTIYSPVPAGNWDKELPTQMLASVGKYGFWTYALGSGDLKTIRDVYPRVKDYLAVWKRDGDGLVVHRAGEWDWEDWGENIDDRVLDNAWYCLALEGAEQMGLALGDKPQAAAYRAERLAIGEAVNAHLWNGQAYRTPSYKGATDDRANALAVVAGIAGPDRWPAILRVLAAEEHASPYMEKYVLEALALMGEPDAAVARMKRRYGPIIASPLTTLPEMFVPGGTDNHAWSGGPLTVLSEYILGVGADAPGYSRCHVTPRMGPLHSIEAVVPTAKGVMKVAVRRSDDEFVMTLSTPRGVTTIATIPVPAGREISATTVNGKALAKAPGVKVSDENGRHLRLEVPAGSWRLSSRYK